MSPSDQFRPEQAKTPEADPSHGTPEAQPPESPNESSAANSSPGEETPAPDAGDKPLLSAEGETTGAAAEAGKPLAQAAEPTVEAEKPAAGGDAVHEGEGLAGVLQSLAATIVIAVFVITFIVQAFQIPSESMEDTLLIGDYLLVDKAHFGPAGMWRRLLPYSTIKRGDIIVFRYPIHPSQHFVKRVIGVPGDRVKLVKKHVFVNGNEIPEDYVVYKRHDHDNFRDNFPASGSLSPSIDARWYLELRRLTENGQLIVPQGSYFVMGDNREESLDSRYWGFVPQENVVGRPLLIYWSVERRDEDESPYMEPQGGKLARLSRSVIDAFHNMRWHRTLRLVR